MAYEDISIYLHNKRQKALHKVFMAMENKVNLQCSKILYLVDCMVMHGTYYSNTVEKVVNTGQDMHNKTTWNEKLFASKLNQWYNWYLSRNGIGHYAINSLLFLTTAIEKYVKMYERFIMQLQMYAKAIWILSKGYLPISLLLPSKLQETLGKVKKAIQTATQTTI